MLIVSLKVTVTVPVTNLLIPKGLLNSVHINKNAKSAEFIGARNFNNLKRILKLYNSHYLCVKYFDYDPAVPNHVI